MNIYEFRDYRSVIADWMKTQPKAGRGSGRRIAQYLGVSTVLVSQVISGKREFSLEQALRLADLLGLSSDERDYFFLLVNHEKAGSKQLTDYFAAQIKDVQEKRRDLKSVIKHRKLDPHEQAIFYSSWIYSATRLLCDIPTVNSVADVSARLSEDPARISKVLEFLIQGSLVKNERNKLSMATQVTHLGRENPLVNCHHENWRRRAGGIRDKGGGNDPMNLFYTGPMVISKDLADKVFQKITMLIQDVTEEAREAKSEELFCLGIDWFKV